MTKEQARDRVQDIIDLFYFPRDTLPRAIQCAPGQRSIIVAALMDYRDAISINDDWEYVEQAEKEGLDP